MSSLILFVIWGGAVRPNGELAGDDEKVRLEQKEVEEADDEEDEKGDVELVMSRIGLEAAADRSQPCVVDLSDLTRFRGVAAGPAPSCGFDSLQLFRLVERSSGPVVAACGRRECFLAWLRFRS